MKNKLVIAITSPISIVLIKGQLKYFSKNGYEVVLICPENEKSLIFAKQEGVRLIPVNFTREISLIKDLLCLIRLIKVLYREKPDIVNAGTPKASLLTLLAAYITGVKKRIYTCRGLRFEAETAMKRSILMLMEKVTAFCAHSIICISASVMRKALEEHIFPDKKVLVLGKGSSNGIDLEYYNPSIVDKYHIPNYQSGDIVFGYIGRFIERKGINELVKSFVKLNNKNTWLLMVGGYDEAQLPEELVCKDINNHNHIYAESWVDDIRPYLKTMDILLLPAYWEGFGNVLIQAAAFGIPVIATHVSGCVDAVSHDYNGKLIAPKNITQLTETMKAYLEDEKLRDQHGKNGKKWAENFRQEAVWTKMNELYSEQ